MIAQEESDEDPLIHILEVAGNAIIGGMEKYVYNLAQNLPAKQFMVSCVTPYESAFTASLRHLGCEVFVTPMDNDPPWRSIQFLTELVRHKKVDLLHAHLPRAHVLAGLTGRLTDTPVVATIHGMEITTQELGIFRTTGTHLTVVCQEAYSQALALGVPVERLTLISNGVDIRTFAANRSGLSFRRALHIPPSVPLVGFVGRLSWEKGPDQFIQVAEYVHKQRPDVQFAIVGEGPIETELREQIHQAGLEGCVHLAGLWTNTWEVYPAFDIFAQTSRVEGMPFALLEAMACGKPVVAMAVGGVAEIVEVGTTGLVSASADWAGLGKALLKLLENAELAKTMGQAGRKRVEEAFDLQNSIRLISNLFKRLLGQEAIKENGLNAAWHLTRQREGMELETGPLFPKGE